MLNKIKSLVVLVFLISFTAAGQNCPEYSNTATGLGVACGGQNYAMTVPNTGCNGEIYFDVVGNYGTYGNEITWEVVSVQSGVAVASGGPGTNNGGINFNIGPLDPNIHGNVFILIVYDSWGDGFSGGGYIQIEQGGNVLANVNGNFGAETSILFNVNVIISAATITINTPSGNIVSTVNNCNDFITQVPLNNANFCNTINVDLPWTITCDISGAILASGNHSVTVYPEVPSAASDLVLITWNTVTCTWDVNAQNDCDALDIGTVFNISPNPSGLPTNACANGNQDFTVDYIGLAGSPDCCATGGPSVPITYNSIQNSSDAVVASSPFGGTNNSAYFYIAPSNSGGNATSLTFDVNMTNYCYPNVPGGNTDSYWVTIYVDGNVIYDQMFTPPPNDFNATFDLTDIPGGYNQNSEIEVYIYPNTFAAGGTNTTFVPGVPCSSLGSGQWTANFDFSLSVSFEQTAGSPVNCSFAIAEPQTCCGTTNLSASNPATMNVDCADDVPPADPAVVTDATSDCSVAPTVTFVSEVSDNNVCNGEQLTRTYQVEDACGNTILVTHTIIIDSYTPTFTLVGTDPTTCGGTEGFITISGLDPNTSYEIGYNGGATQTVITDANGEYVITGLGAGAYTNFSIAASSCLLCEVTDATVINLDGQNALAVDAGPNQEVCAGATVTLTGTGAATTYTWDNGVIDGEPFTPVLGTTTYTVIGTDANGCTNSSSVDVTVNPLPTIGAGIDQEICEGTEVTLSGSGGVTYTWDNGVVNGTAFTPGIGTNVYTVTGVDANGCINTATVTINVVPAATANFTATPSTGGVPLDVVFTNNSSNGTTYTWDFGNGELDETSTPSDANSSYTESGEYTVVLTVDNGICSSTFSTLVIVFNPPLSFNLPNIFTPNNDNSNDIMHLSLVNAKRVYVEILNRWGVQVGVIDSVDPNDGWDGLDMKSNKPVSDGVYFYKYEIEDMNGEVITGHHFIHLITKK